MDGMEKKKLIFGTFECTDDGCDYKMHGNQMRRTMETYASKFKDYRKIKDLEQTYRVHRSRKNGKHSACAVLNSEVLKPYFKYIDEDGDYYDVTQLYERPKKKNDKDDVVYPMVIFVTLHNKDHNKEQDLLQHYNIRKATPEDFITTDRTALMFQKITNMMISMNQQIVKLTGDVELLAKKRNDERGDEDGVDSILDGIEDGVDSFIDGINDDVNTSTHTQNASTHIQDADTSTHTQNASTHTQDDDNDDIPIGEECNKRPIAALVSFAPPKKKQKRKINRLDIDKTIVDDRTQAIIQKMRIILQNAAHSPNIAFHEKDEDADEIKEYCEILKNMTIFGPFPQRADFKQMTTDIRQSYFFKATKSFKKGDFMHRVQVYCPQYRKIKKALDIFKKNVYFADRSSKNMDIWMPINYYVGKKIIATDRFKERMGGYIPVGSKDTANCTLVSIPSVVQNDIYSKVYVRAIKDIELDDELILSDVGFLPSKPIPFYSGQNQLM